MAADRVATEKPASESNIKETVEQILVAFILAFIFRAFVVEAFVIPTGSMAPTLYGAHMRFRCPDCGYVFDVGYSAPRSSSEEDPNIPASAFQPMDFHCPNCGYTISHQDRDTTQNIERPVRFGDRILVLKYLYLFQKPQRGDTVVFKSPSELGHDQTDPDYAINFIKRLIGIGPETIVLLDGDVYVGPAGSENPADFHVWHKPDHVQQVLWRNIYDDDFIPHLPDADRPQPWAQPWQPSGGGRGWTLGRSRVFSFNNTSGQGTIGFNPAANPATNALTDWLGYDEKEHADYRWQKHWVSDLKLGCNYTRRSGDGALRMMLTRNDDCFVAQITPGKVTLLRSKIVNRNGDDTIQTGPEQVVGSPVSVPELSGTEPARVEMTNVDYRVSVRVAGREVIATTASDYAPDVPKLWKQAIDQEQGQQGQVQGVRPIVQISAANQSCTIEHLDLARDIFYLNNRADAAAFWGSPERPAHLNAGEYFVLGDNSFISGDARYWSQPIALPQEGMAHVEAGRVPEQFMLGKAFFVYWPAGYRLPGTSVNIVPDFGDMRFIH